ncbi:hypothetical protein H0H93_010264 [Arthromyces matolae]|nr:hypothetical protein H0H93_010264 [Arthromyces matolae]
MAELGLFKLGQTPMKDASARIARDLVRDIQIQSGRTTRDGLNSRIESTMSSMPTPPSFSRYRPFNDTSDSLVMDSSLESMMRRVGLNVPSSVSTGASTSGSILRSHASLASHDFPEDPASSPTAKFGTREEAVSHSHAHDDLDSDSDSMDEISNTAHPSHAFLMASAGMRNDSDDSFESNHSSDSLGDDHEGAELGLAPPHPFAANVEDDGFDDSYEDEMFDRLHGEVQEETLFGVLPHQRMQASNALYQGQGLRMLGEDLLQDTIGIGARIGRVEESPTPASRQ